MTPEVIDTKPFYICMFFTILVYAYAYVGILYYIYSFHEGNILIDEKFCVFPSGCNQHCGDLQTSSCRFSDISSLALARL